jgi:hypothetical protein
MTAAIVAHRSIYVFGLVLGLGCSAPRSYLGVDAHGSDGPAVDAASERNTDGAADRDGAGDVAGGEAGQDAPACVDTQSDRNNCGACGHDCLGGDCQAGQCQPLQLAQYRRDLLTISVGAQYVYVTDDAQYMGRANKDGSDLTPLALPSFASSVFLGGHAEEDGDRVFYTWNDAANGGFRTAYCSTSDCDGTTVPFGSLYSQSFTIDHTNHRVFWIEPTPARFWVASTLGTPSGAAIPSADLPVTSSTLAYDQGGVLFWNGTTLERLPASGGSFGTLSTAAGSSAPALNSTTVFWSDGSAIVYVPLPNGTGDAPNKLVDVASASSVVADDTSVYWATSGSLETCLIASCAASRKSLPAAGDSLHQLAIDQRAVYWIASTYVSTDGGALNTGSVWKLAK